METTFVMLAVSILLVALVVLVFLVMANKLRRLEHSLQRVAHGLDSQVELTVAKVSEKSLMQQRELQEMINDKIHQMQQVVSAGSERQQQSLENFRGKFLHELKNDFKNLNETIEKRLSLISDKVNESLEQGLKKTRDTFTDVIQRLTKIDEAQKKIEQLSSNVVSLQDVLTDKKSRGIWGEVQLNQILSTVFGENSKVYSLQYKLSNAALVDAMLFLPEPTGKLAVDSKFPLENYKKMHDKDLPVQERDQASKEFIKNVKKHVDDIARKYIIKGETAEQAIMFIPAEAIFSELHAYFYEVIDYANAKKVWITSPTTFMAVLSTVQVVMNNMERTKYAHVIHEELNKLSVEFHRYRERWDNLSRHLDTVSKDVKDIHITTDKITSRFGQISKVDLDGANAKGDLPS